MPLDPHGPPGSEAHPPSPKLGPQQAPPSDAALVRAALARQAGAAPAIVARYRPLVRRWLWASVPGHDMDDLVQEVFARCFQCLPRLRDPAALRSFLIGITLRLASSERRRRRRRWRETLTSTGELPDSHGPDDGADARQAVWCTREVLSRLSPESVRVLELRFLQDKELTEVADGMGVSLATAKRHLARASARLRAMGPALRGLLRG